MPRPDPDLRRIFYSPGCRLALSCSRTVVAESVRANGEVWRLPSPPWKRRTVASEVLASLVCDAVNRDRHATPAHEHGGNEAMATTTEAATDGILDLIVEVVGNRPEMGHPTERAGIHAKNAEAYAWLRSPKHAGA